MIPLSLVRVMVALSEQADDKFRNIALETISELGIFKMILFHHSLAIRRPSYAAYTGIIKSIFSSLNDGSKEMMEPLVSTVLYLLDSKETRKFVRPQVELEVHLSSQGINFIKFRWE